MKSAIHCRCSSWHLGTVGMALDLALARTKQGSVLMELPLGSAGTLASAAVLPWPASKCRVLAKVTKLRRGGYYVQPMFRLRTPHPKSDCASGAISSGACIHVHLWIACRRQPPLVLSLGN